MKHVLIALISCCWLMSASHSTVQSYWVLRTTDPIRGAYFAKEVIDQRLEQMNLKAQGFDVRVKTYAGENVLYLKLPPNTSNTAFDAELLDMLTHRYQLQLKSGDKPIFFSKKHLKHARVKLRPSENASITLILTPEGQVRFADITREHIGKKIDILIDNIPLSSPLIHEAITGGEAIISGAFTIKEANRLVFLLNAPVLHYPLERIAVGHTQ